MIRCGRGAPGTAEAEQREVTLATCGCQGKAAGEPASQRPGSAGEVARDARARALAFSYFYYKYSCSDSFGGGGERRTLVLVQSVRGVAEKPCPPPIAAALGWVGVCGAAVGRAGGGSPRAAEKNLCALSLGSAIPSPAVALPPIPLSWGAPSTWAASFVKCRAAERPGGQPSGPPKIPKSRLSWTGFREQAS